MSLLHAYVLTKCLTLYPTSNHWRSRAPKKASLRRDGLIYIFIAHICIDEMFVCRRAREEPCIYSEFDDINVLTIATNQSELNKWRHNHNWPMGRRRNKLRPSSFCQSWFARRDARTYRKINIVNRESHTFGYLKKSKYLKVGGVLFTVGWSSNTW